MEPVSDKWPRRLKGYDFIMRFLKVRSPWTGIIEYDLSGLIKSGASLEQMAYKAQELSLYCVLLKVRFPQIVICNDLSHFGKLEL